MKQILFVCSGNSCRSPMAEEAFRVLADARGLDVPARSAGTGAYNGAPASRMAAEAVKAIGGDLSGFRSSMLTEGLVAQSRLIVAMTSGHRAEILSRFPSAAGKVRLLLEFDPKLNGGNVTDPYGGSLDLYRFTLEAMLPALNNLIEHIAKNLI